jgi:hypothetical protein
MRGTRLLLVSNSSLTFVKVQLRTLELLVIGWACARGRMLAWRKVIPRADAATFSKPDRRVAVTPDGPGPRRLAPRQLAGSSRTQWPVG